MDSIRQAVDLARAGTLQGQETRPLAQGTANTIDPQIKDFELSPAHLESTRIVAGGITDRHGRYYDMLRTQVLQAMDKNSWQFVAITSPTAGCGKTVTASNLALSIARLPERSVLLVDMDLQKPKITEYLGINRTEGLISVLDGRATLLSTIVRARLGRTEILVLPCEPCKSGSAERMASKTTSTLLQSIKREFRSRIVLFDLPPLLIGDDVISILPQMDAVLLVAGVGTTSVSDIKECQKHLQNTPVVRVLVNKVTETADSYHSYY